MQARYKNQMKAFRTSWPKLEYVAYYGQAGLNLTAKLNVNLQAERARYNANFGGGYSGYNRDYAVRVGYNYGIASLAVSF